VLQKGGKKGEFKKGNTEIVPCLTGGKEEEGGRETTFIPMTYIGKMEGGDKRKEKAEGEKYLIISATESGGGGGRGEGGEVVGGWIA